MRKITKLISIFTAVVLIAVTFNGCSAAEKIDAKMFSLEGDAMNFDDTNGVSVHDPTLFKAKDGTYYISGSHIAMAKSDDLINWSTVKSGVFDSNSILVKEGSTLRADYAEPFAWCDAAQTTWEKSEEEWETNVWASDIIYNEAMEKYCYYASTSLWGTPLSVIWFATADNPEGTYEFNSCIVYSGFNSHTKFGKPKQAIHYSFTNIGNLIEQGVFTEEEVKAVNYWCNEDGDYDCSYGKYPNAIDPAPFYDKDGNLWLAYGSFSGGIYVMPLIEETGMPDYEKMKNTEGYDIYFGKQISKTNEDTQGTGEGPYIIYNSESDYYYFFLTYGGLDALGGYNIREYRSKNPDGPYTDLAGNDACEMKNTGTPIIGNYQFSFDNTAYLSAGHSSALVDDDGRIFQAYHNRYNDGEGSFFNDKIHQMLKTSDGWLTMLPLEYKGEKAKAVTIGDVAGEYEGITLENKILNTDSWDKVDSIINKPENFVIGKDGKVTYGDANGTISIDSNSYTFKMTLEDEEYTGAFCIGTKPDGKTVMTFSALNGKNETLWGVAK